MIGVFNLLLLIPLLAALCAVSVLCDSASAAEAPQRPVELSETEQTITLGNGRVKLLFERKAAKLASLVYGGRELMAKGGGYVQIAFTSRRDVAPLKWEYRLIRRTPELVEIAFVNTDPRSAFDFGTHYILRAGDAGFYNYMTWGHDAKRSPGVLQLAQYNLAMRVDDAVFTTAAVDDNRIARLPPRNLLTPERSVMDSTYFLPDGSYYSKYFYAAERDEKHRVHGLMGEGIGIWIIMPSHEHLNGGPEHQELTVHQGNGASQVLLAHAQAAHYGAGIITSDSKDGSWHKVSAPWFVYVNDAPTQAELWQDAKRRAQSEAAAWPYPWLDEAKFQLKRGSVSGQLTFDNKKPVSGARVILAVHEDQPGPLLWQQQWRGYRFYGWADAEGRFAIDKVRPGLYDIYAWQPGTFGTFVQRGVDVKPNDQLNVGELVWTQPTGRELLWQIGTPDRSAHEFGFAENFRQWGLWKQINDAAPNGFTFTIGQSRERDWPFQMAITQKPDLTWQLPQWRVQFNNVKPRTGKAVLTLGVAAYEGRVKPQLVVALNGEEIGSISDLEISGASHRSGIHAGYQERTMVFDAAKLKTGANTLSFTMPVAGRATAQPENTPRASLLWDSLRLENYR